MQPPDKDRPGHSTGPTSPEGKARSSLNSVQHGCCAKTVIVKGESEADFNQIKDGWLAKYQPDSDPELALVLEAVKTYWILLRNQRWYNSAIPEQEDPLCWSEEEHKQVERFTRYRTSAERSFHRALNNLHQFRKLNSKPLPDQPAPAPAAARPTPPAAPPAKQPFFHGQNAKKNLAKSTSSTNGSKSPSKTAKPSPGSILRTISSSKKARPWTRRLN